MLSCDINSASKREEALLILVRSRRGGDKSATRVAQHELPYQLLTYKIGSEALLDRVCEWQDDWSWHTCLSVLGRCNARVPVPNDWRSASTAFRRRSVFPELEKGFPKPSRPEGHAKYRVAGEKKGFCWRRWTFVCTSSENVCTIVASLYPRLASALRTFPSPPHGEEIDNGST